MTMEANNAFLDEKKKKAATSVYSDQLNKDNANYVPLSSAIGGGANKTTPKMLSDNTTLDRSKPNIMPLDGGQTGATNKTTPSVMPISGGGNTEVKPQMPTKQVTYDKTNWSQYDQKLPSEGQSAIGQAKQEYSYAKANNDVAGMKAAYERAQAARAKYGSYIDNAGDGSGYSYFGKDTWSAADRNLSEEAQAEIAKAKQGYALAQTDVDRQYWNSYAEDIRRKNGYTGGKFGNEYNKLGVLDGQYTAPDKYESQYQDKLNTLIGDIENSKFNYDYSTDPAYQSYLDAFTREGESAAERGLAQTAANTGGIASSYSAAVANQARQAYAQKATDMIPTLQESAYNKYANEMANKLNLLNQYGSLDNMYYGQYAGDRDFGYNIYQGNYSNAYKKYYDDRMFTDTVDERKWQTGENELDRELQKYLASLS